MKTILYASDLEQGSRVVLRAALEQAKLTNGKIHFLHVSDQFHRGVDETLGGFKMPKAHSEHLEELKGEIKAYMKQRIHRFVEEEVQAFPSENSPSEGSPVEEKTFDESDIEVVVTFGDPAKQIVQTAENIHADLIVMGDRRVNALSRMFLGSTAQNVIHKASVPVLIVPISNTVTPETKLKQRGS